MNTNELLAAGPVVVGAHGGHIGIGLIVLALLVLGALGYGAVRLTHRVRFNRQSRPVTRPEPPRPESERPSPRPVPPRPDNGWAVETHGLSKRFGPTVAVDDVELLVPRGSAFGYLGPNGAGKTTLIRTLLGLTRANAGTMSLLGTPVPAERRRALARVGAIVDEPRFHPHLTGQDNLRLLAAARGGDADQRIAPSLARVGLAERAGDKVAAYSMGMRQRLGVAACLLALAEVRAHLDSGRAEAIGPLAVVPFVADADDPEGAVACLRDAVASGSYLAISHIGADFFPARRLWHRRMRCMRGPASRSGRGAGTRSSASSTVSSCSSLAWSPSTSGVRSPARPPPARRTSGGAR